MSRLERSFDQETAFSFDQIRADMEVCWDTGIDFFACIWRTSSPQHWAKTKDTDVATAAKAWLQIRREGRR